jgi:thiol-disulfide isomerase/thioredoxin
MLTLILALIQFPLFAGGGSLNLYQLGDWQSVTALRNHQPMIVHFWGVTCGPCMSEMPLWGRFANSSHANVIFIQVDDAPKANVKNLAARLQIDQFTNFYSNTQFDERMRYEISHHWQGETPYTVLIGRSGDESVFSGAADFKKISKWLKAQES